MGNGAGPGDLLRAWRRERSISAEALGALLDRSHGQMTKLENGQRPVTLELAVPLSKITGIPLEELARPDDVRLIKEAAPMLGYHREAQRRRRQAGAA